MLTEDTILPALFAGQFPVYVVMDRESNIAGIRHGAGGERGPVAPVQLGGD